MVLLGHLFHCPFRLVRVQNLPVPCLELKEEMVGPSFSILPVVTWPRAFPVVPLLQLFVALPVQTLCLPLQRTDLPTSAGVTEGRGFHLLLSWLSRPLH